MGTVMRQPLLPLALACFGLLIALLSASYLLQARHAAAASATEAVVYDDTLKWDNWSWNTIIDPGVSSPAFAGDKSMAVTYSSAWAGLSLHTAGLSTYPYSHLQFLISPNPDRLDSLPEVDASLYQTSTGLVKQVDIQPYASPAGNGWYQVLIPLTDLGGANSSISRVQLQDASGSAQPTFYLDDLKFVSQLQHFVYDDTLHWDDWSWSTAINPNATSPVFAGTKSMAITYSSGWAGLSLYNSRLDTAPYSHLSFAIFPTGQTLPNISVSLYGTSGPIKEVTLQPYTSSAGDGWYRTSIPLADLGGANSSISRVQLQEASGNAQPTFYLDDVKFVSHPDLLIYDDKLYWDNWSWNTIIDPDTSSPVFAEAKSMAVTYSSAWAGLSLHTFGFDTSPYSHLSFTIFPSGQALPDIRVSLYGISEQAKQVKLQSYASAAGNGWHRILIPLADLGGSNTTISRVELQEGSGGAQSTFYLDDFKLVGRLSILVPQPGSHNQVLPVFGKPFQGEFPVQNLFDHDLPFQWEDTNGYQTTWWNGRMKGEIDGHYGIDWLMPDGTPLLAVVDGLVVRAGAAAPFYCQHFQRVVSDSLGVGIQYDAPSGERFIISSGHMSRVDVQVGQRVQMGQQIGLSGHSGCAKVPHVHFWVGHYTSSGLSVGIDPYGWEGDQPDPWQKHPEGATSIWLWKEGQAPVIFLEERRPPNPSPDENAPVAITALRWMGWKDNGHPNNEFVQLELDPRFASTGMVDLSGFRLQNNRGHHFEIPKGFVLQQNRPVRIFTGSGANTEMDLYLGLPSGVWDDMGDCARLVRPGGRTMYRLRYAGASC